MQHDRSRRLLVAGALVSLSLALGACASAGQAPISQNANGPAAAATAVPGTTRDAAGAPGGKNSDGSQPLAAPVDRQIIKTGEITLQVSSVANYARSGARHGARARVATSVGRRRAPWRMPPP